MVLGSSPPALPDGVTLRSITQVEQLGEPLFAQIHRYLSEDAYWSRGIPSETLRRAINHSISVVALEADGGALAGFARVVTDRATYAYLCDVFVLPARQTQGLAQAMMHALDGHAELQGLRRWMLMTRDAHTLYARHGFTALADATRAMERHNPTVYASALTGPGPRGALA